MLIISERVFQKVSLGTDREVLVGRSEQARVQISDPAASRKHALFRLGERLTVEDAGSANGTFVRHRRLQAGEAVPLDLGEAVTIGSTTLMIQQRSVAVPSTSVPRVDPRRESNARDMLIADPSMRDLYDLAGRLAVGSISLLIVGETGVGKEVLARRIHDLSPRAHKRYLPVNCAAFTETLFEAEFFGYEKGAFTGADRAKAGLLRSADGGTVFFDEVGELTASTQAKLLRVLESREVMPVGGLYASPIDVRFIAATNRDLEAEIERGTFRRDLYFRLTGECLEIPPLRERKEEIELLAVRFAAALATRPEAPPKFREDSIEILRRYPWPGNVRELKNVIERALLLCGEGPIAPEHLRLERARPSAPVGNSGVTTAPPRKTPIPGSNPSHGDEAARIADALEACGGNQTRAAKLLRISRRKLLYQLDELGLPRPKKG